MPARNLGERKSFECDDDVGFDGQGYLLQPGNDFADDPHRDSVRKTEAVEDPVIGVNYTSTYDEEDEYIMEGWRVPVIHDGYPNVLCEEGYNYELGDAVYVSAEDGIATHADGAEAEATKAGNVISSMDLSDAGGPTLVQIDLTSNLGDAE